MTRFDTIGTERLALRRWQDADREPFAELNGDPETLVFFPSTLTRAESDSFVDRMEARFEHPRVPDGNPLKPHVVYQLASPGTGALAGARSGRAGLRVDGPPGRLAAPGRLTPPGRPGDVIECENGAMLDHVSIQCVDLVASAVFYDAVLAPLGVTRIADSGKAIGYGTPPRADFWIGAQATGNGFRESHLAFVAADRAAVWGFFEAATRLGAEVLHEPREWPEYHGGYYAAFVRDPEGNNIEAVCHLPV